MATLKVFALLLIAFASAKKNKGGGNKKDKTGSTINSCEAQQECMSVDTITKTNDGYRICIMWEHDLKGCSKGEADTLESICYGQAKGDHKSKCNSKEPICQEVECGEYAAFGVDDNADCETSSGKFANGFAFSGVQGVICKSGTQGHMCDDGCHKNCIWYIPAPKCTTTTKSPTKKPTNKPTPKPTKKPTRRPTPKPTTKPSKNPTPRPTPKPTPRPTTKSPTPRPSPNPTPSPTPQPSPGPTKPPTKRPTPNPTPSPTPQPSPKPAPSPTKGPSKDPSKAPTPGPTTIPTPSPTGIPTKKPSLDPSQSPSDIPTSSPSKKPTPVPSASPSNIPTGIPSQKPTEAPTPSPSEQPTINPTTAMPTTSSPTTANPTSSPTMSPVVCIPITDTVNICTRQETESDCLNMEGITGCQFDEQYGCYEECAYDISICAACGCAVIEEDCVTQDVVEEAANAAMRVDVYISDALIGDQMIEGVDDLYVYIGIVMFGLMFICGVAFMVYKYNKRKKKYIEMEDDINALQMNEVEVEEFGTR